MLTNEEIKKLAMLGLAGAKGKSGVVSILSVIAGFKQEEAITGDLAKSVWLELKPILESRKQKAEYISSVNRKNRIGKTKQPKQANTSYIENNIKSFLEVASGNKKQDESVFNFFAYSEDDFCKLLNIGESVMGDYFNSKTIEFKLKPLNDMKPKLISSSQAWLAVQGDETLRSEVEIKILSRLCDSSSVFKKSQVSFYVKKFASIVVEGSRVELLQKLIKNLEAKE